MTKPRVSVCPIWWDGIWTHDSKGTGAPILIAPVQDEALHLWEGLAAALAPYGSLHQ